MRSFHHGSLSDEDEDLSSIKRKQREKKPRHKFSLLYTIPVNVLNEKGSGNKRQGFSTYDALVCKSCKPNKFFHVRDALKLHNSEEHGSGVENRLHYSYNQSNTQRRNNQKSMKTKSKRQAIECIDLDDDDSESEDDEIEVISNNDTSVNEIFDNLCISKENSGINESGYVSDEDIIECESSPQKTSSNKVFNEEDLRNIDEQPFYQPKVVLSDISSNTEGLQGKKSKNISELTLNEAKDKGSKVIEVVLDDDVNAENSHIRNLLIDFESPIQKRKQSFEGGSATKKRCLDDEKLLTEDPVDILDCVEVTINEADEPNMLISDAFSLKKTPKKKSYTSEMSFLDDDIIID